MKYGPLPSAISLFRSNVNAPIHHWSSTGPNQKSPNHYIASNIRRGRQLTWMPWNKFIETGVLFRLTRRLI